MTAGKQFARSLKLEERVLWTVERTPVSAARRAHQSHHTYSKLQYHLISQFEKVTVAYIDTILDHSRLDAKQGKKQW